uniref:G-protein coupled receptors family 1 profile domain-containing protein n=1 Tax=Pelusios castaneus TaxID=367368 RepID=A0A8C8S046_9SAUR
REENCHQLRPTFIVCSPGNGFGFGSRPLASSCLDWILLASALGCWRYLDFVVRILLYLLIFLLSVAGNTLVVLVLALNRRLHTVTNSFLLSLALSDLLMALCCMPFTLVPNLMGTFIFGEAICKIVAYLMSVSVSVSTFSLAAIAIERYSAICNPLQSRVWQTRSHACRVIASSWLLSLLLMLPYAIYSTTVVQPTAQASLCHCLHLWPSQHFSQAWYILLLLILFFIPGVVMSAAYGLISRELCRGSHFAVDVKREVAGHQNGGAEPLAPCEEGDGCYVQLAKAGGTLELHSLARAGTGGSPQDGARINSSEAILLAKKRVIRMLLIIVAMFFLCWLPIFTVNTWRAFDQGAAHRALSGAPISFIHLLSYISTCVNPLVYCFMNRAPPRDDDLPVTGTSLSKSSYTTLSTLGPPLGPP